MTELKWISINDRMPELGERVFVWSKDRISPFSSCLVSIETIYMGETKYKWLFPDSDIQYVDDITHWMPIPKLPEE